VGEVTEIDREALVAAMRKRAEMKNLVGHAVLMGFVARIENGEFDKEES
jgi:hypothetical protein